MGVARTGTTHILPSSLLQINAMLRIYFFGRANLHYFAHSCICSHSLALFRDSSRIQTAMFALEMR